MCTFTELDGTGLGEHLIQIFFLSAGCVVQLTGLTIAILLIGFSPLYLFSFYFYRGKLSFKNTKVILFFVLAIVVALMLSSVLWISAIILGQWG